MLRIEQDIATQQLRSLAAVDRIAAEQLLLRDTLASKQKDILAAAEEGVRRRLEMAAELLKYREAAAKVNTTGLYYHISCSQFASNSNILDLISVCLQFLSMFRLLLLLLSLQSSQIETERLSLLQLTASREAVSTAHPHVLLIIKDDFSEVFFST